MSSRHVSGTANALFRVFIEPNVRVSSARPLLLFNSRSTPRATPFPRFTLNSPSHRTATYKRDKKRHAITDHYIFDEAIKADTINLVDTEGKFHANISILSAVSLVDPEVHHLVQMTPMKLDAFGRPDRHDVPTCRITDKRALREQFERKLSVVRRQAKGQGAGPSMKKLELNWAIAGGDLRHRLEKLREFLKEGRKVEVMLGPKKRGKKASEEEANAVLTQVRDAVGECRGAGEVKSSGEVGGVMMLVFEGKREVKREQE